MLILCVFIRDHARGAGAVRFSKGGSFTVACTVISSHGRPPLQYFLLLVQPSECHFLLGCRKHQANARPAGSYVAPARQSCENSVE
jgi:hypothetical protein